MKSTKKYKNRKSPNIGPISHMFEIGDLSMLPGVHIYKKRLCETFEMEMHNTWISSIDLYISLSFDYPFTILLSLIFPYVCQLYLYRDRAYM